MSLIPNISQSLLKSYWDFKQGKMCGRRFYELRIRRESQDEDSHESSKAMKLGHWFEFWSTGAKPAYGQKLSPIKYKTISGTRRNFNDDYLPSYGEALSIYKWLPVDYQIALDQAKNFRKYCELKGIVILSVGKHVVTEDGCSMTWDIEVLENGVRKIIDLKFTGLIDNERESLGWGNKKLSNKKNLMIQGIHYSWKGECPYEWWIFSSKPDRRCKIIKANISQATFEQHAQEVEQTRLMLSNDILMDNFPPNPSQRECEKCVLKANGTCKDYAVLPDVEEVFL